jgi:hypothetical protein
VLLFDPLVIEHVLRPAQIAGKKPDLRHKRALREILCRQRRPRQGASRRDSGTGLVVGTGVAPAFPPAGKLSIPSALNLPRFACQTTIAAQSIRRKPCGQQSVKPAYSCLTFKNKNHTQLASLRSQLVDARFLRKYDAVNKCCPNTPIRKIAHSIHEDARDVARAIATTAAYAQSRKDRKKVEMLFAHLKRILKLDKLRLRGFSRAQDEFLLAATVQNLRRMAMWLMPRTPEANLIPE